VLAVQVAFSHFESAAATEEVCTGNETARLDTAQAAIAQLVPPLPTESVLVSCGESELSQGHVLTFTALTTSTVPVQYLVTSFTVSLGLLPIVAAASARLAASTARPAGATGCLPQLATAIILAVATLVNLLRFELRP